LKHVTRKTNPIDLRPFLPRAKLDEQVALEARYGKIAIRDVTEALLHMKPVPAPASDQAA
jgi:hypothetical protein